MDQLPDAVYVLNKLHSTKLLTGKEKLKLFYDRHMQYVNWTSRKYDAGKIDFGNQKGKKYQKWNF